MKSIVLFLLYKARNNLKDLIDHPKVSELVVLEWLINTSFYEFVYWGITIYPEILVIESIEM